MKTLVERIRNRELAIENDGSLEELRKVLKHCFPKDEALPSKHNKYYNAYLLNSKEWACGITIDLPTVSVKEVLAEIEGESKEALLEKAKRDYPVGTKFKSIYSGETKISTGKCFTNSLGEICVESTDNDLVALYYFPSKKMG